MQHRRRTRSWFRGGIIILILTALGIGISYWKRQQQIHTIRFTGCYWIDPAEYRKLLPDSVEFLLYTRALQDRILSALYRHPFVQHLAFHFGFNTLTIHITEKHPLAYLLIENSVPQIVLSDTVLPYRPLSHPANLPVITMTESSPQVIASFLSRLEELEPITSEISLLRKGPLIFQLLPEGTRLICEHNESKLSKQLAKATRFLHTLPGAIARSRYSQLDLRWTNMVIASTGEHRWGTMTLDNREARIRTVQY